MTPFEGTGFGPTPVDRCLICFLAYLFRLPCGLPAGGQVKTVAWPLLVLPQTDGESVALALVIREGGAFGRFGLIHVP